MTVWLLHFHQQSLICPRNRFGNSELQVAAHELSAQDIPFDLQHHRYAKYLNNAEGLEKLKEDLVSRLSTLTGAVNLSL